MAPLVMWNRGVHAAGCSIEEQSADRKANPVLRHSIHYTDLQRRLIDIPKATASYSTFGAPRDRFVR